MSTRIPGPFLAIKREIDDVTFEIDIIDDALERANDDDDVDVGALRVQRARLVNLRARAQQALLEAAIKQAAE